MLRHKWKVVPESWQKQGVAKFLTIGSHTVILQNRTPTASNFKLQDQRSFNNHDQSLHGPSFLSFCPPLVVTRRKYFGAACGMPQIQLKMACISSKEPGQFVYFYLSVVRSQDLKDLGYLLEDSSSRPITQHFRTLAHIFLSRKNSYTWVLPKRRPVNIFEAHGCVLRSTTWMWTSSPICNSGGVIVVFCCRATACWFESCPGLLYFDTLSQLRPDSHWHAGNAGHTGSLEPSESTCPVCQTAVKLPMGVA